MKVLIVNRYMSVYGGAEQVIKELACNLRLNSVKNLVLTLNTSDKVRDIAKGVSFIIPEKKFSYEYRSATLASSFGILGELKALRSLILKYYKDYDVINLHNFPASWAAYGINKPIVWMCNEVPDFYNNPKPSGLVKAVRSAGILLDKYVVNKNINHICVADELNRAVVVKRYGRESTIVPYGIEFSENIKADRDQILAKWGLSSNDFLLLQVGVVSPTKNQKESVDAFSKVSDKTKEAKLILAGNDTGAYSKELKEYISRLGLTKKIIFTGQLSKNEVNELYSICHLCLFPVKLQGGYLSVFESIAFGLPVVVSPLMGASGLVKEHDLGIVSLDFEHQINEIISQYQQYKEKAQKAKTWVKDNLTWAQYTRGMYNVFEKAVRFSKKR